MNNITEKKFAFRLMLFLEKCDHVKNNCPIDYCNAHLTEIEQVAEPSCNRQHSYCNSFLSTRFIDLRFGSDMIYTCPCTVLGYQETVKQCWIKLEELGYLEEYENDNS